MTIHKEGKTTLIGTIIILLLIQYFSSLSESTWVHYTIDFFSISFFLLILQFFRKPSFEIILDEKNIYAPADGKIVVIEEVQENEYFKNKRIQISIFMSPFNVHSNKFPISGEVKYTKYHPGLFLMAWHPKSSTKNERNTIVVQHKNGIEIMCTQIAGFLARRICSYASIGQKAKQGEEFGFIKFGSRVDIFLPLDTAILVQLNQNVSAGKTIIAKI